MPIENLIKYTIPGEDHCFVKFNEAVNECRNDVNELKMKISEANNKYLAGEYSALNLSDRLLDLSKRELH